MSMKKKECPSCAMNIPADSKECPICGYGFTNTNPYLKWVALLLAILFLYLAIRSI